MGVRHRFNGLGCTVPAVQHPQIIIMKRLHPYTQPIKEPQFLQFSQIWQGKVFGIRFKGNLFGIGHVIIFPQSIYNLAQLWYAEQRWRSSSKINSPHRVLYSMSPQHQLRAHCIDIRLFVLGGNYRIECTISALSMAVRNMQINHPLMKTI